MELRAITAELRSYRRTRESQRVLEELSGLMVKKNASVSKQPGKEWLRRVAAVARTFEPKTSGAASVYLALLWFPDESEFGVYVGGTG
jgi:hypothetical protein